MKKGIFENNVVIITGASGRDRERIIATACRSGRDSCTSCTRFKQVGRSCKRMHYTGL